MTDPAQFADELEFDQFDLDGDEDAEIPADRPRVHTEQADPEIDSLPSNGRLTHRYCNWSRPRND